MLRFFPLLPLLSLFIVAACAGSTAYGPASGNGYGYSEQRIEADRYRVSYRSKSGEDALDGALRRAAELTLQNGYDNFTVISRDILREDRQPRSSVGIGGSTGSRSSGVGIGISVPITGSSVEATARIEIVMGNGDKPDDDRSYDARTVLSNLSGPASGN